VSDFRLTLFSSNDSSQEKCFQQLAKSNNERPQAGIWPFMQHFSWEEPRDLIIGLFSPLSRLKPSGRIRGLDKGENKPYPRKI
jgi:hypothetical protein